MNKAAFLNIVRQVAPIQDQEVDDLERLVVSFPYCQTAHVLLAKASHDRGSMLSTQKLRRAAAHASNRQLLKQLVYASSVLEEVQAPVEEEIATDHSTPAVLEPFLENEPQNSVELEEVQTEEVEILEENASVEVPFVEEPAEELSEEVSEEQVIGDSSEVELPEEIVSENDISADVATEVTQEASEDEVELSLTTEEPTAAEEQLPDPVEEALPIEDNVPEEVSIHAEENSIQEVAPEEEEELDLTDDFSEEEDSLDELLDLIQISGLSTFTVPVPSPALTHNEIIAEITSASEQTTPIATSTADAEATTQDTDTGELSPYLEIAELDSLYDTSGYEFPTLKLPEVQNPSAQEDASNDPYLSIFTQNNLAYWMGSSRLGESIQLKDDLTSATPFYFQPELILEHVKEQSTPITTPEPTAAAKLDMQLDIINQFLKTTPKRKTLANTQLSNEPQEDLSAKSSKIKKTLVSENLALIFIKQGKGKKAIKIYEQLIVKFPEKKSYFAEQIEKLRNE